MNVKDSKITQSIRSVLILIIISLLLMYFIALPSHKASTFDSIIQYDILPMLSLFDEEFKSGEKKLSPETIKKIQIDELDENIENFGVDENGYIHFYIQDVYEGLVFLQPKFMNNKIEWICYSSLKINSNYGSSCTSAGGVLYR